MYGVKDRFYQMSSISVVIPSLGRDSLQRAIDSVLAQTYPINEVLIILSTRNVDKYLIERYSRHNFIHFLINENGNAASNRNIGICTSKSDFIAFLDDDDIWHYNKIEVQMKYTEYDVISSKAFYRGYSKGIRPSKLFEANILESFYPSRIPMRRKSVIPTPTIVIRSSIAKANLFDENLNEREDIWFLYNLEKAGKKFIQINDVLATVYTRKPLIDRKISMETDFEWYARLESCQKGVGKNFFWSVALRNRFFHGNMADFFGLLRLYLAK